MFKLAELVFVYFCLTSKNVGIYFDHCSILKNMFSDFDSEVVGFKSCPETERLVNDESSQTVDLKTSNQGTQTSSACSTAVQADADDVSKQTFNQPYDAEKLSKFLKKVLPHLEEELKSFGNSSSELSFNQIDNDIVNFNNEENQKFSQTCTQKMIQPDFCKEKIVSSLAWNSTDVMLAVACSEKTHTSWCCHETSIGLYNTEKDQFYKSQPTEILKVSGCVRYIKFHNRIPSLLAGGLYSGEVIVWDLKQDEATLINKKGSGDEAAHVDAITFISWKENENGLWLVSAGRDGRIILWKVTTTNLTYEVHERFLILKQHLVSTAGPNEHLEVVHMDFTSPEFLQFIAAASGGTLFYCSMTAARPLPTYPPYKDPVLRYYKARQGIVTRVSCHTDLFASSGTDSEIHIFKYDQEAPVMKIHTSYNTLLGVQWISPKELLSWGDSKVCSHRIRQPGEENLICNVEDGVAVVAMKTSRTKRNRKLAVGDQNGAVLILNDWTSAEGS